MSLATALKKGLNDADTFGDWDPYPENETRGQPANINTGVPAARGRVAHDRVTSLKANRSRPVEEIVTRPAPPIKPVAKPASRSATPRPKDKALPGRAARDGDGDQTP